MLTCLFPLCAPKRAYAQVEKDHDHSDSERECSAIGTTGVSGPVLHQPGTKHDRRQQKEDAGDFEPYFPAYAPEGPQKAADAASHSPRSLAGDLTGGTSLRGNIGRGLARRTGGSLHAGGYALSGDAHSNSQYAAYGLRSHSIYDGSSDRHQAASNL